MLLTFLGSQTIALGQIDVYCDATNKVPSNFEFARVLKPGQVADIQAGRNPLLSTYSGADDAFITTSNAIPSGLTRSQAADFLTIPEGNVGGIIRFQA